MSIATISQVSRYGLPPAMRMAQEAIDLPEVQEMLHRLSEYQLGIFMPHQHDEETGGFQPLAEDVVQVESGLKVSFQASETISTLTTDFLPVGWFWRAGTSTPAAVCEMVGEEKPGDSERSIKHKMLDRS